jgi:hypothetical protein
MNVASSYSVTSNYSDHNDYNTKTSQTSGEPFTINTKAEPAKSDDEIPIKISSGQEISRIPPDYKVGEAFQQIDSQRKNETSEAEERENNFLQEYIKKDKEEDEDEEDGRLVDYLLKELKGEEAELRAEGNSYLSDEDRMKLLGNHCPDLFPEFYALAHPSSGNLSLQSA